MQNDYTVLNINKYSIDGRVHWHVVALLAEFAPLCVHYIVLVVDDCMEQKCQVVWTCHQTNRQEAPILKTVLR